MPPGLAGLAAVIDQRFTIGKENNATLGVVVAVAAGTENEQIGLVTDRSGKTGAGSEAYGDDKGPGVDQQEDRGHGRGALSSHCNA